MQERLTVATVAERLGIKPSTWRSYVARDLAPKPDGEYDRRTPWWYASTIDRWPGPKKLAEEVSATRQH